MAFRIGGVYRCRMIVLNDAHPPAGSSAYHEHVFLVRVTGIFSLQTRRECYVQYEPFGAVNEEIPVLLERDAPDDLCFFQCGAGYTQLPLTAMYHPERKPELHFLDMEIFEREGIRLIAEIIVSDTPAFRSGVIFFVALKLLVLLYRARGRVRQRYAWDEGASAPPAIAAAQARWNGCVRYLNGESTKADAMGSGGADEANGGGSTV